MQDQRCHSGGNPDCATAVKGIEGYIEDGETGLLVPPGDVVRLRAAVNRLLPDLHTAGRSREMLSIKLPSTHTKTIWNKLHCWSEALSGV